MATRMILKNGDPQLRKHCHEVKGFQSPSAHAARRYASDVGGVQRRRPRRAAGRWLRRAVIVLETNVPDEKDEYMIELINPVIVENGRGAGRCRGLPEYAK